MKIDRINFDQMKFYSINPESVKTLVINLDRTPERYQKVKQQLDANNIKHQRFSAIDGYELNIIEQSSGKTVTGRQLKEKNIIQNKHYYDVLCPEDKIYYFAKLRKSIYPLTAGELGCFCSHRAIWKYMVANNIEYMLILEDDVVLDPNYVANLNLLLQKIPEKWDLIYLFIFDPSPGSAKSYLKIPFNPYFKKFKAGNLSIASTAGYLINIHSAKRLLKLTKFFSKPIDLVLRDLINQKKIIAYKTTSDLLIAPTMIDPKDSEIYEMGRDHF